MKAKLLPAIALLLIGASCSAPKSTFVFGYHDYQAGKRAAQKQETNLQNEIAANEFVASNTTKPVVISETAPVTTASSQATAKPSNKAEQKSVRQEIKKQIKAAVKEVKKLSPKSAQSAQAMDNDLKLAAIFGAVGIVLGALWGVSNILGLAGTVCVVIGLVFLIKWLLRQ